MPVTTRRQMNQMKIFREKATGRQLYEGNQPGSLPISHTSTGHNGGTNDQVIFTAITTDSACQTDVPILRVHNPSPVHQPTTQNVAKAIAATNLGSSFEVPAEVVFGSGKPILDASFVEEALGGGEEMDFKIEGKDVHRVEKDPFRIRGKQVFGVTGQEESIHKIQKADYSSQLLELQEMLTQRDVDIQLLRENGEAQWWQHPIPKRRVNSSTQIDALGEHEGTEVAVEDERSLYWNFRPPKFPVPKPTEPQPSAAELQERAEKRRKAAMVGLPQSALSMGINPEEKEVVAKWEKIKDYMTFWAAIIQPRWLTDPNIHPGTLTILASYMKATFSGVSSKTEDIHRLLLQLKDRHVKNKATRAAARAAAGQTKE